MRNTVVRRISMNKRVDKKKLNRAVLFVAMFLIVIGSVAVSCVSSPDGKLGAEIISINARPNRNGLVYTTRTFETIRDVIVIKAKDRSKKVELEPSEWNYDSKTTALTMESEVPFSDFIVHIEGTSTKPERFVFNGYDREGDLLIIIDDRPAIEGFDYTFNETETGIILRDDIGLEGKDWYIGFETSNGSVSIGNWQPENRDRLAYLEAQHRKQRLEEWYDNQDTFYVLSRPEDWNSDPAAVPVVVKRKLTPEELGRMKSYPISVIKDRMKTSDRALSRELGFEISLPETIPGEKPGSKLPLLGKSIAEYRSEGKTVQNLIPLYDTEGVFILTLSAEDPETSASGDTEFIISSETVTINGVSVRRLREWGTRISSLEERPEVIQRTRWTWRLNEVYYDLTSLSRRETWCEEIIRELISVKQEG